MDITDNMNYVKLSIFFAFCAGLTLGHVVASQVYQNESNHNTDKFGNLVCPEYLGIETFIFYKFEYNMEEHQDYYELKKK